MMTKVIKTIGIKYVEGMSICILKMIWLGHKYINKNYNNSAPPYS